LRAQIKPSQSADPYYIDIQYVHATIYYRKNAIIIDITVSSQNCHVSYFEFLPRPPRPRRGGLPLSRRPGPLVEDRVLIFLEGTLFCTQPGPWGRPCALAKSLSLPPGDRGGLEMVRSTIFDVSGIAGLGDSHVGRRGLEWSLGT
jgi:hypothetical protein